MKTKHKIIITILVFIVLSIVYIFCDYKNYLSLGAIDIGRINNELLSIYVTNLVIILLYIITYFLVDEKNTKERKNKKEIAKYMIENDYRTCLKYLEVLENEQQLNITIENIRKEEKHLYKNDFFEEWMKVSFQNYNDIMQYSNQGIIEVYVLEEYLYIKNEYSRLMTGYVFSAEMEKDIMNLVKEGHKKLKEKIKKEMEKINAYNWE